MPQKLTCEDYKHLSLAEVHEHLDDLHLELLSLVEQLVQCKVTIEKVTNEGRINCAKARYIQGQTTVGISKLPTEESQEFNALVRVEQIKSESPCADKEFQLKRYPIDKEAGFIDPIRWFGVLVPRPLQITKEKFQSSLELVIEAANIQVQMDSIMVSIKKLKEQKSFLNKLAIK
ncbi:coiled-coil domain-containing protein 115 [Episyrphus balteatus]|uniref:coiled-coil domain-containing protein 115 n=1 Tax=Episyrphus balteatus TaxID=286459 RepID=UPI002485FA2F|nr:coiled-coil domain-containing protein 115 [Episyrphus balteatus]